VYTSSSNKQAGRTPLSSFTPFLPFFFLLPLGSFLLPPGREEGQKEMVKFLDNHNLSLLSKNLHHKRMGDRTIDASACLFSRKQAGTGKEVWGDEEKQKSKRKRRWGEEKVTMFLLLFFCGNSAIFLKFS
jgi:hypothetical protein